MKNNELAVTLMAIRVPRGTVTNSEIEVSPKIQKATNEDTPTTLSDKCKNNLFDPLVLIKPCPKTCCMVL